MTEHIIKPEQIKRGDQFTTTGFRDGHEVTTAHTAIRIHERGETVIQVVVGEPEDGKSVRITNLQRGVPIAVERDE